MLFDLSSLTTLLDFSELEIGKIEKFIFTIPFSITWAGMDTENFAEELRLAKLCAR